MKKNLFPFFLSFKKTVYLDNAATTQKPSVFFKTQKKAYEKYALPGYKSIYKGAEEAFLVYEEFINTLYQSLGVSKNDIIKIFSSATTIGYFIYEKLFKDSKKKYIIALPFDGHNNIIGYFQHSPHTIIFYDSLSSSAGEIIKKADIVYISATSHITGQTIDEHFYKEYKKPHQWWIIDACQYAPISQCSKIIKYADIFFFSMHKMYGPYNSAIFYANERIKNLFSSLCLGNNNLQKFTCGSLPIPEYFISHTMYKWVCKNIYEKNKEKDYKKDIITLREILLKKNYIIISCDQSATIVSCYHKDYNAHDIALYLSKKIFGVVQGTYALISGFYIRKIPH